MDQYGKMKGLEQGADESGASALAPYFKPIENYFGSILSDDDHEMKKNMMQKALNNRAKVLEQTSDE